MASLTIRMADVKGLTPALDPRRAPGLYTTYARNVAYDTLGPWSAFGNRFLSPEQLFGPEYFQSVRVVVGGQRRTFIFVRSAILEWSEMLGGYRVLYLFDEDTHQIPHRWTSAYINGYIYFCHPAVGIYWLQVESGTIAKLAAPGVPARPIAIAENNGRLCVIDRRALYWSAQSDGFDFTPALGGAGFQVINDRIPGEPIMLESYARGLLVMTTGGMMRSEFTGDQEVYRHRGINTEYAPVNSFCTMKIDDDTIILLDSRGLFQTRGESPQPFAPLFNEFLIGELKRYKLLERVNLRLEWDLQRRFIYLSMSYSDYSPLYDRAYVLYPALDKWGSFDEKHYGIGPVIIGSGTRSGDYQGFVDSLGRFKIWTGVPFRERTPTDPTLHLYTARSPVPARMDDESSHWIMPSHARFSSLNESHQGGTAISGGLSGYYTYDGGTPAEPAREGLDSLIRIGLFRFSEEQYPDEISEVTDIMVGSVMSQAPGTTWEDYETEPGQEDYEDGTGTEDLGDDARSPVNYHFRIIGSNDGRTVFTEDIPVLQSYYSGIRYFASHVVGVWMSAEFGALNPGEAYHIQVLEVNGVLAGRVN